MRFSIITINYNNLEGLKKTAESVLSQILRDFEWIIIDGGSTDGSREYIIKLNDNLNQKGWNPISYWCSEPDNGIYNAMNKGIIMANGEYINFMNSGDCYYDCKVLWKIEKLNYNEDVILGDTILIVDCVEIKVNDASSGKYDYFFFKENSIPHQATFFKKDIFDKYGLYDDSLKIVGDWEHAVRSIYLGNASIRYVPLKICLFGGNGCSSNRDFFQERWRVFNGIFPKKVQEELYTLNECKKELDRVKQIKMTKYMYLFVRKISTLLKKGRAMFDA